MMRPKPDIIFNLPVDPVRTLQVRIRRERRWLSDKAQEIAAAMRKWRTARAEARAQRALERQRVEAFIRVCAIAGYVTTSDKD